MLTHADPARAVIGLLAEIRAEARLLAPDVYLDTLLSRAIIRTGLRCGLPAGEMADLEARLLS
jgi:hypothetical protein